MSYRLSNRRADSYHTDKVTCDVILSHRDEKVYLTDRLTCDVLVTQGGDED